MTIPEILFIIALILAGIEQVRDRGQSLALWAVILICVGLLYGIRL